MHTHTLHTHIHLLIFLPSLIQHQTPQACPSVVQATHHIQSSEHLTCLFHFWITIGGDRVARKRHRGRESEIGTENGERENEGEQGCMQTKLLRQNRHKVLSARQNARSAPLKQDLFRNEHNCQIAIIGSFLNECDSCWWFAHSFSFGTLFE